MCSQKRHRDNLYPGDRIKLGCETFLADWEEALEQELINNYTEEKLFTDNFCFNISKACEEIDMSFQNKPKFSLDGIKQDPSMITMSDSPNSMETDKVRREERARRQEEKDTRERWEKERMGIFENEENKANPVHNTLPHSSQNEYKPEKVEEKLPDGYEEVVVDPREQK